MNAVDPSGCIIQLTGTVEEQQIILSYLQELTDHSLAIAKNGTVYISAFAEDNIKYENGNNLLTRMIDNEHTTTIIIDNNTENQTSYRDIDWAYNKKGVDAVVILNIKNDPDIMTIDSETGNVRPAKGPGYIGLAHEMIHADRLMRGVAIKRNKFSTYRYQIDKVKKYFIFKFWSWMSPVYRVEKVRKEELATIGLKHNKKGDITENMIRKEHGLNLRGAYYLYENN